MDGQTQDVTKKEITLRMPCELYEALQGMSAAVGIPDIARYIGVLSTDSKLNPLDFFKEDAYMDKKGGRQRQNFEWY